MFKPTCKVVSFCLVAVFLTISPVGAKDKGNPPPQSQTSDDVKYSDLDRANLAGEIRGVFERCGGNASGIFVYIVGRSFNALLSPDGHFTLSYVPPGTYSLAFVQDNHVLTTVDNVEVRKHQLTDLGTVAFCPDADNDGYDESEDCNDNNPLIHPGADEVCDGLDNDCNGQVDDVLGGCVECTDADNDGFFAQAECEGPVDCDDNDPTVSPSAGEACFDNIDNNCDGQIDENCGCPSGTEDCDGDGSCETNTNTDSNHCGACNNACAGNQSCQGGQCQLDCASNETECSGQCVDLTSDSNNCGRCGSQCGLDQVCTSGSCHCPDGQTQCGGACVDTQSDPRNCGGCNLTCGSNEVCNAGRCEGGGGSCVPGTVCDADGDGCTKDFCDSTGTCVVGSPVICADDGNACTADVCQSTGPSTHVCNYVPTPGAACDDGDSCTSNDTCGSTGSCVGTPVICEDGNACTDDFCNPATGQCFNVVAAGTACDDGNLCTTDDVCNSTGTCQGSPVICADDNNPCTAYFCQVNTGQCTSQVLPDGTDCGNGGVCQNGVCTGL